MNYRGGQSPELADEVSFRMRGNPDIEIIGIVISLDPLLILPRAELLQEVILRGQPAGQKSLHFDEDKLPPGQVDLIRRETTLTEEIP